MIADLSVKHMEHSFPINVKLARQRITVVSEDSLRDEIVKHMNILRNEGWNWVKKTRVDFANEADKEIMHRKQALIPKYIELKH